MERAGGMPLVGYRIRGDRLYNESLLLSRVDALKWLITSPDHDMHVEDLGDDRIFRDVKRRPVHGVLPAGVAANVEPDVFDPVPGPQ